MVPPLLLVDSGDRLQVPLHFLALQSPLFVVRLRLDHFLVVVVVAAHAGLLSDDADLVAFVVFVVAALVLDAVLVLSSDVFLHPAVVVAA